MIFMIQQGSSDLGTFACCLLPIALLIFIIVIAVMQSKEQDAKKQSQRDRRNRKLEELKPVARTAVGKYLAGLPNVGQSSFEIDCAVVGNDFLFLDAIGRELDKIPRNSINQIIVDDKSQITQRLTVPRIVALGIFAFAAPKAQKYQTFCLAIDWEDNKGVRQNTVFEFTGEGSAAQANAAANLLKKYTKPKVERLQSNERKCLYCAEIIKREAKICRFCRSELPEHEEPDADKESEIESVNTVEEKIGVDVILESVGGNKIGVIQIIRKIKGLGLAEAKSFVESTPVTIAYSVSQTEAEEIGQILKEAGASVEIN